MLKHKVKVCPGCGDSFVCNVKNPAHCQCAGLALSKRLVDQLAANWRDCLCAACLRLLADADCRQR